MTRKLYLVPMIHMSADMGSLAPALSEKATAKLGQEIWQKHEQIVSGFWDSIARFFASIDVKGSKVYQDGLVTVGDEALKIVREGAKAGSQNYQIVSRLVERGALLVKTEDILLVQKEYNLLKKMAQAKSLRQQEIAGLQFRLAQRTLLEQRDKFIAARINDTLKKAERGILFIGAYHDVLPWLARDILVTQVKDVAKVRAYHKALIIRRRWYPHLRQLAEYLVSPISGVS